MFTHDWFSEHIPAWEAAGIMSLAGTPCRLLEIGSMEGRSAAWMLDNLCIHADARLTCVDPFVGDPGHSRSGDEDEAAFHANVGHRRKLTLRKMRSEAFLLWHSGPYDLVYIDGDHEASSVLTDFVLVRRLLKPDAFVVFDDYTRNVRGCKHQPKEAVDAIISMFEGHLQTLILDKQAIFRWRP